MGTTAATTTTVADLPTCTAADHQTSYDGCMLIQTTCTSAVELCESAGGSVEAACKTTAENVFTTALAAVSYSDCECDISCSGSSMLFFSVFAVFMKFLF